MRSLLLSCVLLGGCASLTAPSATARVHETLAAQGKIQKTEQTEVAAKKHVTAHHHRTIQKGTIIRKPDGEVIEHFYIQSDTDSTKTRTQLAKKADETAQTQTKTAETLKTKTTSESLLTNWKVLLAILIAVFGLVYLGWQAIRKAIP